MRSVSDFAREGYFGPEIGDILLQRGQEWFGGQETLPEHLRALRGPQKMCFRTCTELAFRYPDELVYAEGYAFADIPIQLPLAHAWLLYRDQVVDPTWSGGSGYFGIAFSVEQLQEYLLQSKEYGILQSLWCNPEMRDSFLRDMVS